MSPFGDIFGLAQITAAVACGYDEWRYGPGWREAAPKLSARYDTAAAVEFRPRRRRALPRRPV